MPYLARAALFWSALVCMLVMSLSEVAVLPPVVKNTAATYSFGTFPCAARASFASLLFNFRCSAVLMGPAIMSVTAGGTNRPICAVAGLSLSLPYVSTLCMLVGAPT
jgi:hypothetical protein